MRIRLVPLMSRGASGDLSVGAGLVEGAEDEKGLEGGHGGAATVVAEDVFVEIVVEVRVGDAAVGACGTAAARTRARLAASGRKRLGDLK